MLENAKRTCKQPQLMCETLASYSSSLKVEVGMAFRRVVAYAKIKFLIMHSTMIQPKVVICTCSRERLSKPMSL